VWLIPSVDEEPLNELPVMLSGSEAGYQNIQLEQEVLLVMLVQILQQ